ncbi:hypothetical protein G2W53_010182 [Senna tora]|uniref:Uncharacterized protein n=1 Tax=Senna tora TaxID=362788 RepID=A0A834WZN6_9FABA|nr:hypothetical protein G2W53_010182 [Senna tora]
MATCASMPLRSTGGGRLSSSRKNQSRKNRIDGLRRRVSSRICKRSFDKELLTLDVPDCSAIANPAIHGGLVTEEKSGTLGITVLLSNDPLDFRQDTLLSETICFPFATLLLPEGAQPPSWRSSTSLLPPTPEALKHARQSIKYYIIHLGSSPAWKKTHNE